MNSDSAQARFAKILGKGPKWSRRSFGQMAIALAAGLPGLATANQLAGRKYLVKPGDTLSHLALRFQTTIKGIQKANGLKGDLIRIGQTLVIPIRLPKFKHIAKAVELTQSIVLEAKRWKWIVAHHSGIEAGNARAYEYYHRDVRRMRGGLAYHFVIGSGKDSGDGEVEIGSRWKYQQRGGHVQKTEVNDHGIGICLVGNFQNRKPTSKQMEAFHELMDFLQNIVLEKKCLFAGHKEIDLNHTVCPGRQFPLQSLHTKYD